MVLVLFYKFLEGKNSILFILIFYVCFSIFREYM